MDIEIKNDLLFIGVPRERFILPEFSDNLGNIAGKIGRAGLGAELFNAGGHRVDRNRDKIARAFLEHKLEPDWLLMLDSDMEHPVSAPFRLMAHRVPVVGALYFHRGIDEPLAFMEGRMAEDEWGRRVQMWDYIRDTVYEYLEAVNMPNASGSFTVSSPINPLVEVDAVGTGCMLIHRSVIESMTPPWFEYRDGSRSEDLGFCYRVRHELGLPVYVDMSTISGHYVMIAKGQAQFRSKYRKRGIRGANYTPDEAVEWLNGFGGYEDGDKAMADYDPSQLEEIWAEAKAGGLTDLEYYQLRQTGKTYLLDLLWWNASNTFAMFREMLVGIEGKRVLVIGSGIGTVAIQMALQNCDVVAVEPNEVLREFSLSRWEWTKKNKEYAKYGFLSAVPGLRQVYNSADSFDMCIAIDVLEHIEEEELWETMEMIGELVVSSGRMFVHNNWSDEVYSMHHDYSGVWDDMVAHAGFAKTGDLWLVKV